MTFQHSRVLFRLEDGRPMRFYMPPSEERAKLRPIVEHGGGVISSKYEKHSIRLAVPGKEIHEDGALDPKFITDCVEKSELISMNKYKLRPGTITAIQDDDLEPSHHVIHVENKNRKGRKTYLVSEDKAIVKYLLSTNTYTVTGGNNVWKDMEFKEVVPGHSWQSLKHRYRHYILPNIHDSRYKLRNFEVAKLTNSVVVNKDPDVHQEDSNESDILSSICVDDIKDIVKDSSPVITKESSWKSKRKKPKEDAGEHHLESEVIDDFDRELLSLASEEKQNSEDKEGRCINGQPNTEVIHKEEISLPYKTKLNSDVNNKSSDDNFDRELERLAVEVKQPKIQDKKERCMENKTKLLQSINEKNDKVQDASHHNDDDLPPPLKKSRRNQEQKDNSSAEEVTSPSKQSMQQNQMMKESTAENADTEESSDSDKEIVSPVKRNLRSRKISQKSKSSPRGDEKLKDFNNKTTSPQNNQNKSKAETSSLSSLRIKRMALQSDDENIDIIGTEIDCRVVKRLTRSTRAKVPLTMVSSKKSIKCSKMKPQEKATDYSEGSEPENLSDIVNKRTLRSHDNVNSNLNNSAIAQKRTLRTRSNRKALVSKDQDLSGVTPLDTISSEPNSSSDEKSMAKPSKQMSISQSRKKCQTKKNKYKKMPQSPIMPYSNEESNDSGDEMASSNNSVQKEDDASDHAKMSRAKNSIISEEESVAGKSDCNICKKTCDSRKSLTELKSSVFPKCYSHKKKSPHKQFTHSPANSNSAHADSDELKENLPDSETNSDVVLPDVEKPKPRHSYQQLGSSLRHFLMAETQSTQSQFTQPENEEEPLEDDVQVAADLTKYLPCIEGITDALEVTPRDLFLVCHWVSGSLDDAVSYILLGKTLNGKRIWKSADDAMLQNGGEAEYHALEQKYGEEEILARQQYLAQNLIQE